MPVVSIERVRYRVRSSFWVVPALCAVAAVVAGVGLVVVDRLVGDVTSAFLFPGPPEGARSFLSGQFSPRILRNGAAGG